MQRPAARRMICPTAMPPLQQHQIQRLRPPQLRMAQQRMQMTWRQTGRLALRPPQALGLP